MWSYSLVVAPALALALSAATPAQGMTWIVDLANGPGTHFTDLPPAVAAAADGDTIIVRAGSYSGFTTGKALMVLGEPNAAVQPPPTFWVAAPLVEIAGLGAGKTFVMKGITVTPVTHPVGINLVNNFGRVHLERVSSIHGFPSSSQAGLAASDCAAVTVSRGDFAGGAGLVAVRSTLSLTDVTLRGANAAPRHTNCEYSSPGAILEASTVYLSRTSATGGSGLQAIFFNCPKQPAVSMSGSTVIVSGDSATALVAGGGFGAAIGAIVAVGGQLDVDTNVQLFPSGAPPIQSTGTAVTLRRVVSLTAAGAPPGGTVPVDVLSPAGNPAVLFLSLPADPLPTPFGVAFVDVAPGRHVVIPFVPGASERTSLALPVPLGARWIGWPVALQVAHLDLATARAELSNPAVVVLF